MKIKKAKYLFVFNENEKNEIVLPGEKISDYLDYIYESLYSYGKISVQKITGEKFSKKEIKDFYWGLYDEMEENLSIIELKIVNSSFLSFYDLGEPEVIYDTLEVDVENETEEMFSEFVNEMRLNKCEEYLNQAIESYEKRTYKALSKGFDIKNFLFLKKAKYSKLKKILSYYQNANIDKKNWTSNLYYIVEQIPRRSGDMSTVSGLLNYDYIRGSRHEGVGLRKGIKMRGYTKEEKIFCYRIIKEYIEDLIIKSKINQSKETSIP